MIITLLVMLYIVAAAFTFGMVAAIFINVNYGRLEVSGLLSVLWPLTWFLMLTLLAVVMGRRVARKACTVLDNFNAFGI